MEINTDTIAEFITEADDAAAQSAAASVAESDGQTIAAAEDCPDLSELTDALHEARLKLSLLLNGAAKEKLNEAAALAEGMIKAGAEPDSAAQRVIAEYPHLKLVSREIPVFSAESRGTGDGFAAIRSIFAKR